MRKTFLQLLCGMTFLSANCQNVSLDKYLQKQYTNGELNGNVLVMQDNELLYENSFGIANAETEEPLTSAYRFNVGSIYKEFPGVAILQLKEKGKLRLTDTIDNYLEELPEWAKSITIQNLLQYTSGLPRIPWGDFFKGNIPITEKLLKELLLKTEEPAFPPGSDYLYSNFNPILLTQIVESITEKNFESYVVENLFKTAQMENAFFAEKTPYQNERFVATSFNKNLKTDVFYIQEPKLLMNFTAQDLYQWLYHLHNHKLISKQSIQLLSERAGSQSPLGVLEWDKETLKVHHHHGSSGNYEAVIRYYPNEDLYIVILTNQKHSNVSEMADNIYGTVIPEKG